MQIVRLHKNIYRLYSLFPPEEQKSEFRKKAEEDVKTWEMLHKRHVSDEEKQKLVKFSRATYYRRKKFIKSGVLESKRPHKVRQSKVSKETIEQIRQLRLQNKTYGKQKITVLLKRDFGIQLSESTVGRILKKINLPKSPSSPRFKRKRSFKQHAQRFQFKSYEQMVVGEKVQIDHMTVTKNGKVFKHFAAWERKSKWVYANIYAKADSKTAAKFLRELVQNIPYQIKSIQVDGGSEFMKYFYEACKELGFELEVLPPARPKYNGGVERSNRIFRDEFYHDFQEDTLMGGRIELKKYLTKYNTYRPHNALKGKTPKAYFEGGDGGPFLSHML